MCQDTETIREFFESLGKFRLVVDGMAGSRVPAKRINRSVFSGLKTVFVSLGDPSPRPPGICRIGVKSKGRGEKQVGAARPPRLAFDPWDGPQVASQQSPILRPGRN